MFSFLKSNIKTNFWSMTGRRSTRLQREHAIEREERVHGLHNIVHETNLRSLFDDCACKRELQKREK
jgi:hypothetical protein